MTDEKPTGDRRRRRLLSPREAGVSRGDVEELTQAEGARKRGMDTSVVLKLRWENKDAAFGGVRGVEAGADLGIP